MSPDLLAKKANGPTFLLRECATGTDARRRAHNLAHIIWAHLPDAHEIDMRQRRWHVRDFNGEVIVTLAVNGGGPIGGGD